MMKVLSSFLFFQLIYSVRCHGTLPEFGRYRAYENIPRRNRVIGLKRIAKNEVKRENPTKRLVEERYVNTVFILEQKHILFCYFVFI